MNWPLIALGAATLSTLFTLWFFVFRTLGRRAPEGLHLMLDVETLGLGPTSALLQIGAVVFDMRAGPLARKPDTRRPDRRLGAVLLLRESQKSGQGRREQPPHRQAARLNAIPVPVSHATRRPSPRPVHRLRQHGQSGCGGGLQVHRLRVRPALRRDRPPTNSTCVTGNSALDSQLKPTNRSTTL
jgi:hypothetical protein